MKYLAILLLLSSFALAKDKHAPLPDELIHAKTVYIDNQSGYADIADRCYDALSKWGRFKVVTNKKDADLIFLFTTKEVQSVTGASSTEVYGTTYTNVQTGTSGATYLYVGNPTSGDILWSQSKPWRNFHSSTKDIIKNLKERIEEQEKANP